MNKEFVAKFMEAVKGKAKKATKKPAPKKKPVAAEKPAAASKKNPVAAEKPAATPKKQTPEPEEEPIAASPVVKKLNNQV